MLMLNKSQPYGKIAPAWQPDEFDRPAYYEQNGKMFDAHGRLIEAGKPLQVSQPAPADAENDEPGDEPPVDVAALLEGADTMPWPQFRKRAREVLGDTCPGDKAGMKAALATALEKRAEQIAKRQHKAPEPAGRGLTYDDMTGDSAHMVGTVNLAAWGRGRQQYIFGEVAKAIRTKYHKQVSERRDAVDFLIEQGVITKAEARKDV